MKPDQLRDDAYKVFIIFLVIAGTGYVLWGADVIPETLAANNLFSFVDDVIVIIALFLIARKWKVYLFGTNKAPRKAGWFAWTLILTVLSGAVWYIMLGVDIIPDGVPFTGFLDDAALVLGAIALLARIRQAYWPSARGPRR